jgi:hypothetical protein
MTNKTAAGAFVLMGLFAAGCENPTNKTADSKPEKLLSDGNKVESLRHGTGQISRKRTCDFTNPDTSVCGIKIRDAASAAAIIGNSPADSLGQYHFYSKLEAETLTLVQHPGDAKNQISIFKVAYSDKASYSYRQLPLHAFSTEKGIRLGMSKKQLLEKLGTCYNPLDSTRNSMVLSYRIEAPKDSKTRLLATNSMPIYYASYKLNNDKVVALEFGFEYP